MWQKLTGQRMAKSLLAMDEQLDSDMVSTLWSRKLMTIDRTEIDPTLR